MRKILLPLLLATTFAAPAFARPPQDGDNDRSARSEHRSDSSRSSARSESRNERAQAPQRTQRSEARAERQAASPSRERANRFNSGGGFEGRPAQAEPRQAERERQANVNERGRPTLQRRERSADSVSTWRERERQNVTQRRIESRRQPDGGEFVGRREAPPVGARPDRPAPLPQTAQHRSGRDRHPEWRTSWRNDHRYDWRNHRRHHRSLFRLGFYFDPFGWGYQRYNVGWRLWPTYYSSNYWLNDPYMYRLPYAPWPYKWVRYYDDALLVNTITGQIEDVIYDFFW